MRALDRKTLRGLWAAIPTPWKEDGSLDEAALARNCERLAESKVDGIYTTDSDGEFYAIENDEFARLAEAFGRAMEPLDVDAAMGVTWCNTAGTIERTKASVGAGIPNVHVAFPFFMPLADPDVPRFFDDLAAGEPEARWIHYAHSLTGPLPDGEGYARLAEAHPVQFIGTKLGPQDLLSLTEKLLHSPMLAHFVVDTSMVPGLLLGAVGCYSYWCNTLPKWHRDYMDACLASDWEEAGRRHRHLIRWELEHVLPLRKTGHRHGIIGKVRGALTGFLEDGGATRAPYYPVAAQAQETLRAAFLRYWADALAQEPLLER